MRIWLIALAALLWSMPTATQAAAGADSGPRAHWSDMQKLEYYVGQLSGMLNICGYFSLSSDLKELANLSPYGREGLASVMAYDAIKGGYCGKLAADGEAIMADRDPLWAYLTRIYDCPGDTCLPEGGDNTENAACRAEAETYLGGLPLKEDAIKSITMRRGSFAGSQVSSGRWGNEAWVRLASCAGWVIVELTEGCTPRRSFTRGACEIEGLDKF